jgi:hypothetical protein
MYTSIVTVMKSCCLAISAPLAKPSSSTVAEDMANVLREKVVESGTRKGTAQRIGGLVKPTEILFYQMLARLFAR